MSRFDGYLTLGEAAEEYAMSRVTLWRHIKEGRLQTYISLVDRRETLVKEDDLEELFRPILKEDRHG